MFLRKEVFEMDKKRNRKRDSGNGEEKLEDLVGKKRKQKSTFGESETELESEIKELTDEIEIIRKELAHYKKIEEEYLNRLKRVHADYDNYRKRVLREQVDTISRANRDLIEKLLPVIDSFEHALAVGEDLTGTSDEFYKGVKMIYDQLTDTLEKAGVTVIDPHGTEFNPHECEAAITEDVAETEEGEVLEVLRKGYKLNDFLIRPAVVKVCKRS
jgi:molecular chaperone GrpE